MAQDNRFDLARLEQIERRLQVLETYWLSHNAA
jgi:hypothetical protein